MEVIYEKSFLSDIKDLKDNKVKAAIINRIDKIEEYGETGFGDSKPITDAKNLFELRFHYGAGYRVYFTKIGKVIIVLLCGGIKDNQKRDIKRAKDLQEKANEEYKNKL